MLIAEWRVSGAPQLEAARFLPRVLRACADSFIRPGLLFGRGRDVSLRSSLQEDLSSRSAPRADFRAAIDFTIRIGCGFAMRRATRSKPRKHPEPPDTRRDAE